LSEVVDESATLYQVFKNWFKDFKLGRKSCKHASNAGHSTTVVTKENIGLVYNANDDRGVGAKL
jgi:hypothetical protein